MNKNLILGHAFLLSAILAFGVLLYANGAGGGIVYDCLMYIVLAGFLIQFVFVLFGDRISIALPSKLANKYTFSLWVGAGYSFIMLRDTEIGIVYSLLVLIPGILMGFLLISMMQFLLKRIGF